MMLLTVNKNSRRQGHYYGGATTSLVKVLMIILVTWEIGVVPSSRTILVASQCDNSGAIAFTRLQNSACGSNFPFSCPDSLCSPNYDGLGSETQVCTLDNTVQSKDGVTISYSTIGGYSPGDGVFTFPVAVESTYIELSGSVQGSVSATILSIGDCIVSVNDQECASCDLVYCNGDESTIFVYPDCSNLGQGYIDFCDTETFGSPGDLLQYLYLADFTCGEIASSEGGTTTTEGGGDTSTSDGDTTTEGGDSGTSGGDTTSDGDGTTTEEGGDTTSEGDGTTSGGEEEDGSMVLAPMQCLLMVLVASMVSLYLD